MKLQQGFIFERYGYFYLRYRDNVLLPDGTIVRKHQTERLAKKNTEHPKKNSPSVKVLASKFLAPINAGEVDVHSTMRLKDFINDVFLPEVKESLRRSTYKNYSDIARLHVVPRIGNVTLRKFRCKDAERLLKDVSKQSTTLTGEPLSHSTLERVKAFLSSAFKSAKRQGAYDGENPIKDSKVPTGKAKKATHAYSEDEINAIAGLFDGTTQTAILLAAHTGLRKGELEGLLWKDYNGRTLTVRRSLWNGFSQLPKTEASAAAVHCNEDLREVLRVHRQEQGETWARDGFPILQSEVHSPLSLANLTKRRIIPRLEACIVCGDQQADHTPESDHPYERDKSLPRWAGWHAFRRGLATNLHADGVPDLEVQGVLRHSDVGITQRCYIKTMPQTRVDAMENRGKKMKEQAALCTVRAASVHRQEANRPN